MPSFVLDASAALPWCFKDESTPFSVGLLRRLANGEEIIVPAHWPTEILSALIQGKRRSRIDDIGIEQFIRDITSFCITVEQSLTIPGLHDLKALSDRYSLTAYDAAYLDLAKRMSIPLATMDTSLVRACAGTGADISLKLTLHEAGRTKSLDHAHSGRCLQIRCTALIS